MECEVPEIVKIQRISDPRGNLAVIQPGEALPFTPVRCYWLNDVPCGEMRTGHAYHKSREFIVALAGSFSVTAATSDGRTFHFSLSRPDEGLLMPPLVWREIHDFTTNSVGLILASTHFDEADYIRNREDFQRIITERQ